VLGQAAQLTSEGTRLDALSLDTRRWKYRATICRSRFSGVSMLETRAFAIFVISDLLLNGG
jgi:hypothetical protein